MLMRSRKVYEFKPDPTQSPLRNRLHLTKQQRLSMLKWLLYGLLLLVLSLLQDVVLSRLSVGGGTTELVACGILLICLLQSPESGGIFALVGSVLYVFSGSAPGYYSIALLTFLGVLLNILRHSLLSKRFRSIFPCAAIGVFVYEMAVFAIGAFLGSTYGSRMVVFLISGILNILVLPVIYPIACSIGKIGGKTWKD